MPRIQYLTFSIFLFVASTLPWAYAADVSPTPNPLPTPNPNPIPNPNPTGSDNVQSSPNITLSQSSQDKDTMTKLFDHATFKDFEKQPEVKPFSIPQSGGGE